MIQRLAVLIILASAVAWSAVVLLDQFDVAGSRVRLAHVEPDQGWRRTNAGWEQLAPRVLAWHASDKRSASSAGPEAPLPPSETDFRWDFHPAIFALVLLSAAAAAFGLFPARRAVAANRQSQSLF